MAKLTIDIYNLNNKKYINLVTNVILDQDYIYIARDLAFKIIQSKNWISDRIILIISIENVIQAKGFSLKITKNKKKNSFKIGISTLRIEIGKSFFTLIDGLNMVEYKFNDFKLEPYLENVNIENNIKMYISVFNLSTFKCFGFSYICNLDDHYEIIAKEATKDAIKNFNWDISNNILSLLVFQMYF